MIPLAPDNEWFRLLSSRPARRNALAKLRAIRTHQAASLEHLGLIRVTAEEQRKKLTKQIGDHPDIGLRHFLADRLCLPKNPFQTERYRRLRPVILISILMLTLLCASFLYFERLHLISP